MSPVALKSSDASYESFIRSPNICEFLHIHIGLGVADTSSAYVTICPHNFGMLLDFLQIVQVVPKPFGYDAR
eukprot:12936659-Prorocentrum_lima.AAC.1